MKKSSVLLLFLLSLVLNIGVINAQKKHKKSTNFNTNYTTDAIYLKKKILGTYYVKNGKDYHIGFMANRLKREFAGIPEAEQAYKTYKKQFIAGRAVALAGISLAIIATMSYTKRIDNNSAVLPNVTEGVLYSGGVSTALIANVWSNLQCNNTLQKAVFLRNAAICNQPKQ